MANFLPEKAEVHNDGGNGHKSEGEAEGKMIKSEAGEIQDRINNLKSRIFRIKDVLVAHGRGLSDVELNRIDGELEEAIKELDFLLRDQKDLYRGMNN